jgi:chromosome segregation ATPase
MDINQAARMIEWLDEERRQDKGTIATLEERLAQQQEVIDKLQRRLSSIESDQTVIKSQSTTALRESEILDQVRQEMRQLLEEKESKRLTAEREAERRTQLQREQMTRPVQELSEKITKLERTTTEVPALQMERERTTATLATVQQRIDDIMKKLDEPERRLAFLEEQRRQDVRRISEIESDMPEIQKQIDNVRPKLTLLEDLALRNERRVQEVQNGERGRREQIQQFIDQQTLVIQERDKQIEDLLKKFGEQDSLMQQNIERFETWEEAYRQMRAIVEDFQRISDRLERRINEVAEMQRLSEERFRQEWNDWRNDDQKRWKQFTLSNDEVWRLHDKDFDRYVERLDSIVDDIEPLRDSISRLWKLERERAQLYRDRYQAMLTEYDDSVSHTSSPSTATDLDTPTTNGTNSNNTTLP